MYIWKKSLNECAYSIAHYIQHPTTYPKSLTLDATLPHRSGCSSFYCHATSAETFISLLHVMLCAKVPHNFCVPLLWKWLFAEPINLSHLFRFSHRIALDRIVRVPKWLLTWFRMVEWKCTLIHMLSASATGIIMHQSLNSVRAEQTKVILKDTARVSFPPIIIIIIMFSKFVLASFDEGKLLESALMRHLHYHFDKV